MKAEGGNVKTRSPALIALGAAFLFGASTPAIKLLVGQVHPQLLAGLLYLGSGMGLLLIGLFTKAFTAGSKHKVKLQSSDLLWLTSAIVFGGIVGPILLMLGLCNTRGGEASLLLNMESVFTAVLAWFIFKENFDRRIFIGMLAIVVGSIFLTWQPSAMFKISVGSLAIMGACLGWALDNNFTRNISSIDPMRIAAIKGLVAGLINCLIALAYGNHLPSVAILALVAAIGLLGYGVSLVLFIKALRYLGASRTSAYFSTAPFVGAILSILFLHEPVTTNLSIASCFMIFGVWLHLTEVHEHEHVHTEEEHEHLHWHDEHHGHEHAPGIILDEPHSHWHKHMTIKHSHPHYPDQEHRHVH